MARNKVDVRNDLVPRNQIFVQIENSFYQLLLSGIVNNDQRSETCTITHTALARIVFA